ncbi:MAG: thiolase family protein [Polyangiaceae bacterium]|nr:thiolase family protein [Polyangiaceae bacterium]
MKTEPVYIASATRTPLGSLQGSLSSMSAPKLGAVAIEAAMKRAGLDPATVDQVYMGNVLSAGVGQAPARQAAVFGGVPKSAPCTTISKVCGSGLEAVVMGARQVALGDSNVVLTGGMESMSNVPYYLPKVRTGLRMGDSQVQDGMILDGLWDPYNKFHMGSAGEICCREHDLTRAAQDEYAAESYRRAREAQAAGKFKAEITAVNVPQRRGDDLVVAEDEEPNSGDPSKFGKLRPAFEKDGTITAANASTINDGAAAVVLASEAAVKAQKLTPIARILGWEGAAQEPEWFTTAPVKAIDRLMAKLSMTKSDFALWEINEAFSCVAMICNRMLELDPTTVNVNGGAVALGHPIGASGCRILVTLLYALEQRKLQRGVATLCIGGGEAVAVAVERL